MKKVSVVVPCYNVSMYLPKCIDQLLNQTIGLENIEIILVDDASTDDGLTWGVISDYERKYPESIIAVHLEENLRQGGARNVGVTYASAEYLFFLDSDDWLLSKALEHLYRAAIEQEADVVETPFKRSYSRDNEITEIEAGDYQDELFEMDTEESRKSFLLETMKRPHISFGSQGKLFRTSLIREHNIRFAEHLIFEEPSFVVPLKLYVRRWFFLNEMLYIYYMSQGSSMRSDWFDRKWDNTEVWMHLLQELKERGALNRYYTEIEYLFVHWYMMLSLQMWSQREYMAEVSDLQRLQSTVLASFPTVLQNKYLVKGGERSSSGLALQILRMQICDESVALVNDILRDRVDTGSLDPKGIKAIIDILLEKHQYEEIEPLMRSNKESVKKDNDLATIVYLCELYKKEKAAVKDTVFSKVSTVEELIERYTSLKFLLRRLDFGVSDCGVDDLYLFLHKNQVSPYELTMMVDFSVVHKDRVWKEIKGE